jgi:hypothetical protein
MLGVLQAEVGLHFFQIDQQLFPEDFDLMQRYHIIQLRGCGFHADNYVGATQDETQAKDGYCCNNYFLHYSF